MFTRSRRTPASLAVLAVGSLAMLTLIAAPRAVLAGPTEVVYSITGHTPGHPKTNVPGSTLKFTNFNNRMFRSPNSNLWLVVPTTDGTPATQDQVLVIGSGLTGRLLAREGVTEFFPGERVDFSTGLPVPRVSDGGAWAMNLTPQGMSLVGQRVIKGGPDADSPLEVIARTGDFIPGLLGSVYGLTMHSPNIDAAGNVAFVTAVDNDLAILEAALSGGGNTPIISTFVTIPTGQGGGETAAWSDIDTNLFFQDGSGTRSIARGKLNTSTTRDQVAVVDGVVVVQEGVTSIPGSGVASSISDVWMESDGTWFVRGSSTGGPDWILRNGVVIAAIGQPILPGSGERWTSFQEVRGNNSGEWVIVGSTDNADALRNNVAVLGRRHVLARESDGVDLDNDGVLENNLFIHSFRDRCVLQNDGRFYFTVRMKSTASATSSLGANASLVRTLACPANFNADGAVDPDDLSDFISGYFSLPPDPRTDYNGDGAIDPDDLSDYIGVFFGGC